MPDTIFFWTLLIASAVAFLFICLMTNDLWRQRHRKRIDKISRLRIAKRVKRAWDSGVRGYDYPELLLEDMEIRLESQEEQNETKIHV